MTGSDERRDLMRLTYAVLAIAGMVSGYLLWRDDTAAEMRGAIWTVWGGGALITALTFWFGSSAGKGRQLDGRPAGGSETGGSETPPEGEGK